MLPNAPPRGFGFNLVLTVIQYDHTVNCTQGWCWLSALVWLSPPSTDSLAKVHPLSSMPYGPLNPQGEKEGEKGRAHTVPQLSPRARRFWTVLRLLSILASHTFSASPRPHHLHTAPALAPHGRPSIASSLGQRPCSFGMSFLGSNPVLLPKASLSNKRAEWPVLYLL
jgi:hypothetical protein